MLTHLLKSSSLALALLLSIDAGWDASMARSSPLTRTPLSRLETVFTASSMGCTVSKQRRGHGSVTSGSILIHA